MPRLPRYQQQPASLAQMFGLEPEVGKAPSSIAFNDYLGGIADADGMNERNREARIIAEMDNRASALNDADRLEANAVRGARNMGFDGTFPLREQADYGHTQKLRQILLPEQMKLEAARTERETGRAFDASQRDLDRRSREGIATGAQSAQLNRVNAQQQAITARANEAREAKRGPVSRLFSWLTGSGGSATPTAPAAPNGASGMVLMEAPTGEQQMVDASRVQEFLAKGAIVVE